MDFNPGAIVGAHLTDHEMGAEPTSIVVHVASVAGGALIGAATWGGLCGMGKWVASVIGGRDDEQEEGWGR